jgi:hypothetical protein
MSRAMPCRPTLPASRPGTSPIPVSAPCHPASYDVAARWSFGVADAGSLGRLRRDGYAGAGILPYGTSHFVVRPIKKEG